MDKTPKHHGDFYFEPDIRLWKTTVLENRRRFASLNLWGQSIAKVRSFFKMPVDCPLILTGHQPVFFYPGLWAKCLAASQLAQAVSGVAYHKVTDTALSPEFTHFIPELDEKGKAHRQEVDFFSSKKLKSEEKAVPYAFMPAPEPDALQKILLNAGTYGPDSVKRSTQYFSDRLLKGLNVNAAWSGFHTYTLNLLDEISGTKRLFLEGSALWTSEPFLEFLAYWLTHMAELNGDYNDSLNEYRKKQGITHEIQPMPNLKFEDWFMELPFWGTSGAHHRDTVWAKVDGKTLILKVKGSIGQHIFQMDNLKNELNSSKLRIWPKAIPQTLFCRMYLCDFFIHGIGGGLYEEVGDIFFEKTMKIKPPGYGVVSATYFVDFKESEELDVIVDHQKALEWWERALEQNPEYLFTRQADWQKDTPGFMHASFQRCFTDESLKRLAAEKIKLLADLKDPAKRSDAGKKIKEVNEKLFRGCSEALKAVEQGLLDAKAVQETRDVLAFREYPFFCFEKEVFLEMNEKIRRAAAEGWK